MHRIRVAIINEGTAGGIRKRIFNVIRNINPERFEISAILSGNRKGYTAESDPIADLRQLGVAVHHVPMVREISPLHDARSLGLLRKIFAQNRFDILHAHCAKAGFLTRWAAALDKHPNCIYSPHVFAFQRASGLRRQLYLNLERIAARWKAFLVVDSQGEKECALKYGLAKEDGIFIQPDAVEIPDPGGSVLRASMNVQQDKRIFLTTGRLIAYKGHYQMIRAFAQANTNSAELWIAGDGDRRPHLEKLAGELGVSNSIRFLGHRSDVFDLLNACDCFLMVSRAEGSPHSLLEALAMEKPIIATAVSGIRDYLQDPSCSRLVPWNDIDALSNAIRDFVRSPFPGAKRSSLPGEWFDVAGQVRKLERIYENCRT